MHRYTGLHKTSSPHAALLGHALSLLVPAIAMAGGCCSSGKCQDSSVPSSAPQADQQQQAVSSPHSSSDSTIITEKSAIDTTEENKCVCTDTDLRGCTS
jgi:hypothetical protein